MMNRFFLGVVVALVAAYHGANLAGGRFYKKASLLKTPTLSFYWDSHPQSHGIPPEANAIEIDAASKWIGEKGYELRYELGQVPERVAMVHSTREKILYLRDDFALHYVSFSERITRGFRAKSEEAISFLKSQGVIPIEIPIPPKTAFERENFGKKLPSSSVWISPTKESETDPYLVYRAALHSESVDLYKVYRDYLKKYPGAELYHPYAMRWSSLGIALAAQAVLLKLQPSLLLNRLTVQEKKAPLPLSDLDMLDFFQLPSSFIKKHFLFQETPYSVESDEKPVGGGRLILAGTCFSHRFTGTDYSLAGQVNHILGRELIDVSREGGASLPGLEMLRESHFRWRPGDIFMWEYTIREPWDESQHPQGIIRQMGALGPVEE